MAKTMASRTAVDNAEKAVQGNTYRWQMITAISDTVLSVVFGGAGFNTEYPVEKLYRDAKIFELYEGMRDGASFCSDAWR